MSPLAVAANEDGEGILTRIGPDRPKSMAQEVCVRLDEARRRGDVLVVPMCWEASRHARLLPTMDADLEVAPLGPDVTQVSLLGRYDPPLGAAGRAVDRLLLHRVAEASVRSFLNRLASAIEAQTEESASGAARTLGV